MKATDVTDQERAWSGEFGDSYIGRNDITKRRVAAYLSFWGQVLSSTRDVGSVFEFGANVGLNVHAIRQYLPEVAMDALEINPKACEALKKQIGNGRIYNQSFQTFMPNKQYDLVFTRGVLIHINPAKLNCCYEVMHKASKKYILMTEYYNPKPVTIQYRGHEDLLFKRDFAGEFMDMYPDVKLRKYGFAYHRDPVFPQDDFTWFLLEKV